MSASDVHLLIVGEAVVLNTVRIKDVVDVFGVGDENLWAQDRALWYTAVQIEDV